MQLGTNVNACCAAAALPCPCAARVGCLLRVSLAPMWVIEVLFMAWVTKGFGLSSSRQFSSHNSVHAASIPVSDEVVGAKSALTW